MKILVLTSSYPRYEGDPTAPFIESLVRHTAGLGHELHVVVPQHREWDRAPTEDGITFHPYRYSPVRSWTPWGFSQSLEGGTRLRRSLYGLAPLVAASAVRTCNAVARARRIDVMHAHWLIPNGPIAALAARRRDVPLAITVHGSDVALAEKPRWTGLARWSLEHADATTAASRHLLDRVARLGANADRLELIPLGTDLSTFGPESSAAPELRKRLGVGESDVLVLGIGRLVRLKGFEYLVEALALARERAHNVRLVIAGDGEMSAELSALAQRLGLDEHVALVGAVERRDVPAYFAAADFVAVPTVHEDGFAEGLGYVVLEAQATGRAVIASRVGGLAEVVHDDQTGILVPERDPRALADAIVALAQQPELRRRLGEGGRARAAAAPSWDDVARMWVDLYGRLVDARTRPSGKRVHPPLESTFDGHAYWEQRLQGNFDLEGVGFSKLGHRYNSWMYRVRGEVFDRVVDRHLRPMLRRDEPLRVLDIGSGTGFYVDRWLRLGAEVTGVDLTEIAVERLATTYSGARFVQADIGRPLAGELQALEGTMDAISAFDVLFHITDDDAYARALANICLLLRPGGLFLWSDNFLHGPTVRLRHQVSRSLAEITHLLSEAGLTIVDRVPMFVLMNQPTDVRSRWPRVAWSAMLSPAVVSDRLGGGLGALLYPVERRLVSRMRESPTTELMVCERPSSA